MARELQNRVVDLIEEVTGTTLEREVAPTWLMRPGAAECGAVWPVIRAIYSDLTDGAVLPDVMPARERRSIDGVLTADDGASRIVEIDEAPHFTPPRARTFAHYPSATRTAFEQSAWAEGSSRGTRMRGGGFGRPTPPLFPEAGGRHLQRAFRDSLADLLPSEHGWLPTLRVGDFEVKEWLFDPDAEARMAQLLETKGIH
ncbi:hypothetical protein [Nocardioides exalbidus]|uniref:hypothetical protein n=1 Tax=Nocardioides exalbidus TaxID=402596 RepID=UPI000B836676|nr:hypothetical protein [Nocardioides exalbidus]